MAEIKKYLDTAALTTLVDNIKDADAVVLQSAKDYADGLAGNYDAVGSAASAQAAAKSYTDTEVAKANGAAATAQAAAEAAQGTANTAVANAATAQAAAEAAQGDVDALEALVGELPADAGVATVVAYVDKKTYGIATDAALAELQEAVDTIEADYLKAADKTELSNAIAGVQAAVDTEKGRAEGIEAGLESRLAAVEGDYLKADDKTELQDNIDEVANALEILTEGIDAEKVDGVKDLIDYVEKHGVAFTGVQEDIAENAEAIEALDGRMTTAEGAITGLQGAVATKVEQAAYDTKIAALEGADSAQVERIAALEAKFTGDESVEAQIAAAVATEKSEREAADNALNLRVVELEKIDHDHSNKAALDLITADLITAWNAAEQNAKDYAKNYADGLNTTMQGVVDGIDERVVVVEGAVATKAEQADLNAAVARIAANETAIAANAAEIASFVAIDSAEVDALFGIAQA